MANFMGVSGREKAKKAEKLIITGLVVPRRWNAAGKVLRVSIKTFNEDEYFVAENKMTKKLLKLLRQKVEIDGIVKKRGLKKFLTESDLKTHEIGEK